MHTHSVPRALSTHNSLPTIARLPPLHAYYSIFSLSFSFAVIQQPLRNYSLLNQQMTNIEENNILNIIVIKKHPTFCKPLIVMNISRG